MNAILSLFPPLFGEETLTTRFEWGRIQAMSDWMSPPTAWLLVGLGTAAMLAVVVWIYLRDLEELRPLRSVALVVLRLVCVVGLVALFLQPRWRTEKEVTRTSRVVLLVDTSRSMDVCDVPHASSPTRAQELSKAMEDSQFVEQLRRTHDVEIVRFDENPQRLAVLKKHGTPAAEKEEGEETKPTDAGQDENWPAALTADGYATRIGHALDAIVTQERGGPISGVVLVTDGRQTADPPVEPALTAAAKAGIRVYPVGMGSELPRTNLTLVALEAPPHAQSKDPFRIKGRVRASDFPQSKVPVTVYLDIKAPGQNEFKLGYDSKRIDVEPGKPIDVEFSIRPEERTGVWGVAMRVELPQSEKAGGPGAPAATLDDSNADDNRREVQVNVMERKLHVLLLAGGAGREYQFLRGALARDKKSIALDVLLQTGSEGVSQDAEQILDSFPETRQEMFKYDCVVAIDPNWLDLASADIDLFDSWVGEGGGLICIAGPVYTGQNIGGWVNDSKTAKIRALYPVNFGRGASSHDPGRSAKQGWPLKFTREGTAAEFLRLTGDEKENLDAWQTRALFFACQPIQGTKPGATVYARWANPESGEGDSRPAYFASQFYGSGRVFYMGSGELWRTRRYDDKYFDYFYTRLIRWVAQGRLAAQSERGSLRADDTYALGARVEIHADLKDARLAPLNLPSVELQAFGPDNKETAVVLRKDENRKGAYQGAMVARREGEYHLSLPLPPNGAERLTKTIHIRASDVEWDNARRDAALLQRVADQTRGQYFPEVREAFSESGVATLLDDRTQTSILREARDRNWEELWRTRMMFLLCGLLAAEWLIRRLSKLA